MPQFILTYIGGDQPASPEEGQAHFTKYKEWLSSLGNSAVSPANPLKGTCTVAPDRAVSEGGQSKMSGFTVIDVESMDAALNVAKACPFLDINGSLEVSELMKIPG